MERTTNVPEGTPENLTQLLMADQRNYELRTGYSLELKHGLMGYFPALYKGTREVIVAFDRQLIQEVWQTMTPRRSQLDECQCYVNHQTGVYYPILGNTKRDQEESTPSIFLTREEFTQLMRADPHPFEWAPGLVNNDMSNAEFRQTLEAAAKEHGIALPQ